MSTFDEFEEKDYGKLSTPILRRLLLLLKPHWRWVAGFLLSIALVSIIDAYTTYLSSQIIDEGIRAGSREAIVRIVLIYGGVMLFQAVLTFGFIYLTGVLGERVRYDMRKQMFNHLQSLSLSYFSKTPVGWIMARLTSDTERLAELITWGLLDITWATVNIITAAVFMFIINANLALIVLGMLPFLAVVAYQFRIRILHHYRLSRKMNSKITGAFNEGITGVRVIKALSREDANLAEFSELTDGMYHASYKAAWLSALFLPTVQLISALVLGFVLWRGGLQVEIGMMTVGGIQAFVSYVTFIMWPIQDMARVYAQMQNAVASAERIFHLIDTEPVVKNRPRTVATETLSGDIRFEDVHFEYESDDPVIKGLTFHVNQGETVALVGPTGGGKTTIVNLLCRFYEPTSGAIYLNNINYLNMKLEDIQSRIGMVLQTPHLFSGSISENIRYGRLNASDEDIEAAAKMAGAHDFIMTFEKGYDQDVGEGGNLLSVGQKQLISIARAILAQPELFIMDEATSSVDTLTEALIQRGMEQLMTGRTSFVIAHRLSTIKRADKIIVIEDGQIQEMGTHRELINLKGKYYNLYTRQFRQELEAQYDVFGK
ncbi:MAG TPA: ABC transporter ATP-binding protein [Brevefilum fermentans]|uniref:Putative ABC transporter n=1 Tax=Candidatus Brevifilum fermentans TaxID=1986204 RepID=A0A1Y6K4P1_9CHLR|nr:ABC transporter ATP-binding protein [Brevefilum fermentans]SMX54665.1 putative ABC transporter [Brevefilum fermentans]HOM66975.1 ABC transporter ATP-binding protein [Brevefilum fermentans]